MPDSNSSKHLQSAALNAANQHKVLRPTSQLYSIKLHVTTAALLVDWNRPTSNMPRFAILLYPQTCTSAYSLPEIIRTKAECEPTNNPPPLPCKQLHYFRLPVHSFVTLRNALQRHAHLSPITSTTLAWPSDVGAAQTPRAHISVLKLPDPLGSSRLLYESSV